MQPMQQEPVTEMVPPPVPTQPLPTITNAATRTVSAPYTGCVAPPPGMVAWYPLDEAGGSTMIDLTGANNGTYYNNPTINFGQYVLNSRLFNGTNQYGDAPDSASLNFGTGDFTIDAWIRTTSVGTLTFVDKRDAAPVGYEMFLQNNHVGLEIADSGAHINYIMSGPPLNDGQWHFVAGVVRRTGTYQVTVWADSTSQNFTNNPRTGTVTNASSLRLARHWRNNAGQYESYFPGSVDEVELFNRALSDTEIEAIRTAGTDGKCKPGMPIPTRTNTSIPPTRTSTRTNTPVPPTITNTNTPIPPTSTSTTTNTPVPPTITPTTTPSPPRPTNTREGPTKTPVPTPTPSPTVVPNQLNSWGLRIYFAGGSTGASGQTFGLQARPGVISYADETMSACMGGEPISPPQAMRFDAECPALLLPAFTEGN